MADENSKEYKIDIDPRILELLGPSLYTNIYYVLAELIANSYDADAKNVYIIDNKDDITVEDDGHGMSYASGDIKKYLNVGGGTRDAESQSQTKSGERERMGRKGVGKLAALSVSENVNILTRSGDESSGFVLTRRPKNGNLLTPIPDEEVKFSHITGSGSAVVMTNPQYRLHKGMESIRRNLLKIFPLVNKDFKIHVYRGKQKISIDTFDDFVVSQLSTLIALGDDFQHMGPLVPDDYPNRRDDFVKLRDEVSIPLTMSDKNGVEHQYNLDVKGWIGTYKSTKGKKAEISDFPDNFISLYAHKKMGEFNILPSVGQNKLNEVYVVGQLHIDIFELTELPDMALSNRQGYKSDDPRYITVLNYVRKELLNEILRMRDDYADNANKIKKQKKLDEQRKNEELLRVAIDKFRNQITSTSEESISESALGLTAKQKAGVMDILRENVNEGSLDLGLKNKVDSLKKRLLISQTYADKALSDVVYAMLLYNRVSSDDIIYTNCDDQVSRIPPDTSVYRYLREFFVESYSTEKIYVVFITSENTRKSWGAITEVGAAWITQIDNNIFNIHPFRPEHPLDDESQWQSTNKDDGDLWLSKLNADIFCQKIELIAAKLGCQSQARDKNMKQLSNLITIK